MTAAAFLVDLELDGDDDTDAAAANVEERLKGLMRRLLAEGQIRGWHVGREPA